MQNKVAVTAAEHEHVAERDHIAKHEHVSFAAARLGTRAHAHAQDIMKVMMVNVMNVNVITVPFFLNDYM